jgi:hypothetical protein
MFDGSNQPKTLGMAFEKLAVLGYVAITLANTLFMLGMLSSLAHGGMLQGAP